MLLGEMTDNPPGRTRLMYSAPVDIRGGAGKAWKEHSHSKEWICTAKRMK
jgi:hypothetical protein